jgi:hypothetical protein
LNEKLTYDKCYPFSSAYTTAAGQQQTGLICIPASQILMLLRFNMEELVGHFELYIVGNVLTAKLDGRS